MRPCNVAVCTGVRDPRSVQGLTIYLCLVAQPFNCVRLVEIGMLTLINDPGIVPEKYNKAKNGHCFRKIQEVGDILRHLIWL